MRAKPTYLKVLEGNRGHRPINHDEPEPDGDLVDAPEHLTARQQKIWRDVLANTPRGLLKKLDSHNLEVFAVAKDGWERALKKIEASGEIVAMPGGQWAQNPYVSIARRHQESMMKSAGEMGMSPVSRTRVKIVGKKKGSGRFGKLNTFKP